MEIVWHGRGGQGAWTASNLLAQAALMEGKFVQSFPTFGPERMGAPVMAFTRINENPIELHCNIYEPDVVVVLDSTLLTSIHIVEGLKLKGKLLVNFKGEPNKIAEILKISGGNFYVYTTPATEIAMEVIGRPIANTAMVGALVKATDVVGLESVNKALRDRFPPKIAELNVKVVEKAFNETRGGLL